MKECYEELFAYKFDKWDEVHQLLERYKVPKFIQWEIGNLNVPITYMSIY